jgi:hypothetical protein
VGALATLFPNEVLTSEPLTVVRQRSDGSENVEQIGANETFRIGDALPALNLREGLGLNFRLLHGQYVTLNLRFGAGFRQNLFNNSFVLDQGQSTASVQVFTQIEDFDQAGAEATLNGLLRITRFLHFITDLEGLWDLSSDVENRTPIDFEWQNTLSFRLSPYLSIDYSLDLIRQHQVIDDLQVLHNVLLRVSWDIL